MPAYGGRFGYEDAGDTPNTEVSILDFGPDKTLVFEVRGLKTDDLLGAKVGVIFYGSEGYIVSPDYSGASLFDPKGKLIKSWRRGGDHFGNFLSAVRSRKADSLHAPILEGHFSSALCHLGNISYRLGQNHTNGEAIERLKAIKCNDDVQETLDRVVTHLADNKVKVGQDPQFRLGERLEFNPEKETFQGNSEADTLLTRDYRAPFVVPAEDKI